MGKIINYYCPNKCGVVLYEEKQIIRMVDPDPPKQCSKCKKFFYKRECIPVMEESS